MIESFEWIGISGIVLEILGFILLLKWFERTFPMDEYQIWREKHLKNEEDGHEEKSKKFVYKSGEKFKKDGGQIVWNNVAIHKKFWYVWILKTKSPIIMVIVGLVFQVIQIGLD